MLAHSSPFAARILALHPAKVNFQRFSAKTFIRPEIVITPEMKAENKLLLIKNGEDAAIAMLPQIREWAQKVANEKMTIKNK